MDNIFSQYKGKLRSHIVEVKVLDQGGKYFLEDDSILREKTLVGFFCMPSDLLYGIAALANQPVSPDTTRPLAQTPAIFSGYLTIQCGSDSLTETYPLIAAIPTQQNPGHYVGFTYNKINPSRPFIQVADPTNNAVTGSSFILTFYYID